MISTVMIARGNCHTEPTSGEGIRWIIMKGSANGSRRSHAAEVKDTSLENTSVSATTQLDMYCRVITVHYSGSDLGGHVVCLIRLHTESGRLVD